MDVSRKPAARILPTSPFARPAAVEPALPEYTVGDRVTHDHYGLGRVVTLHGRDYVSVDFGSGSVIRFPVASRGLLKI